MKKKLYTQIVESIQDTDDIEETILDIEDTQNTIYKDSLDTFPSKLSTICLPMPAFSGDPLNW